jgi:ATP-dependent DNA helicase RecG
MNWLPESRQNKVEGHKAVQVTEQVQRLLRCLQRQPLAVREIMQSLKLNHRPTLLYDYLKPAIDDGFVEMTQPDSPKSPTQKYRLTKKGS